MHRALWTFRCVGPCLTCGIQNFFQTSEACPCCMFMRSLDEQRQLSISCRLPGCNQFAEAWLSEWVSNPSQGLDSRKPLLAMLAWSHTKCTYWNAHPAYTQTCYGVACSRTHPTIGIGNKHCPEAIKTHAPGAMGTELSTAEPCIPHSPLPFKRNILGC